MAQVSYRPDALTITQQTAKQTLKETQ